MSNAALTWAFALRGVQRSCEKFVLVALANYADDDGVVFVSNARICAETCLDRKTVVAAIARLVKAGLLADTGERRGSTGQIVERQLPIVRVPETGQFKSPENGKVTENVPGPFFPSKSPVFPIEESRFSRERVPKTGHRTLREPLREPLEEPSTRAKEGPSSTAQTTAHRPSDDFAEWWKAYPRKTAQDAAEKAYLRARKGGATAEQLLAAVKAHRFSDDPQFRPHPATWLNQGRWKDENPTPEKPPQAPAMHPSYANMAGRLM